MIIDAPWLAFNAIAGIAVGAAMAVGTYVLVTAKCGYSRSEAYNQGYSAGAASSSPEIGAVRQALVSGAMTDGAHHKQYYIVQALREIDPETFEGNGLLDEGVPP